MTGLYGVGGYDSMAYSPTAYQAFMQAYNTPNANQYQAQATTPNVTANQAQAAPTTGITTVPFKGNEKEEKKNHAAAWAIIGTVATIGAAALCRKAYNKGSGTTALAKIGDGFKVLWNGSKNKVSGFFSRPTITRNGENTVCTLPNRKWNILSGNDATELAQKAGIDTTIPNLTDKASKLTEYTFTHDGLDITVKNNKIVKCSKVKENYLGTLKKDEDLLQRVTDQISDFSKGNRLDELRNISFRNDTPNAQRRFFTPRLDGPVSLKTAVTNQFNINSDAVKAYRTVHPDFDTALKNFAEGKVDGLRLISADSKQDFGIIKIKGDSVRGIQIGNAYYPKGSDKFTILEAKNKEIFEKLFENKDNFTNILYAA